jgi:hypothetical protein
LKSGILGIARKVTDRLRPGHHWLAGKYREIPLVLAELRTKLAGGDARTHTSGVNPENLVWIFSSSGRSGSTWLRSIMGEMPRHRVWEEPMVGRLFGDFYRRAQTANLRSANFIMGDPIRKGWIRSIRNFVLDGARYVQPRLGPEEYLVIKEPNGSVGAPLLMEALPESRMILLIRDPRDVVASTLDGAREGNWLYEWKDESGWKRGSLPDKNPNAFVRNRSSTYVRHAGKAKEAFDSHRGHKVLVRYEDLRANTLAEMKRLYATLEIPVQDKELARAVEKHSWENIPEDKKGEGKFYRKATPGGWQEDLTPKQAQIVERITAPLLREFYPENGR